MHMPKVGIKLLLTNNLLSESLVFTSARILFLASLLFAAIVSPFNPYSLLNYLLFYESFLVIRI